MELNILTNSNIEIVRNMLEEALEKKVSAENRDVFIFGTGHAACLSAISYEREGIRPLAFIDNDTNKQGKSFLNFKVVSPEGASHYNVSSPLILINTLGAGIAEKITASLKDSPLKTWETVNYDRYIFSKNSEKVMAVFDMLSDDFSKRTYAACIMARMGIDSLYRSFFTPDQYFCLSEFLENRTGCFVDCGAYTGDTLDQYIRKRRGSLSAAYVFEPSHRNYMTMCARIENLNRDWAFDDNVITPVEAGVGRTNSKLYLNEKVRVPSSCNFFTDNFVDVMGEQTPIVSIDSYFENIKVSFIKADIESYEREMLYGAQQVIKRDKPLLAVCVYHNATDMYEIAHMIKAFEPGYRLSIRHHSPCFVETVLYAY